MKGSSNDQIGKRLTTKRIRILNDRTRNVFVVVLVIVIIVVVVVVVILIVVVVVIVVVIIIVLVIVLVVMPHKSKRTNSKPEAPKSATNDDFDSSFTKGVESVEFVA
jgi:Flp pilus assembly protein TadB